MTTFQDPPPQSRRAVRQSERGEAPAQTPADGTPYEFDAARQGDAAQPGDGQAAQPSAPDAPQHSGRRAQLPPQTEQGSASGEPLTYSTQGRIAPPVDERSQQQPLAAAPPPGSSDQPLSRPPTSAPRVVVVPPLETRWRTARCHPPRRSRHRLAR